MCVWRCSGACVCMANTCHMGKGLHLNYTEWGVIYQPHLFGTITRCLSLVRPGILLTPKGTFQVIQLMYSLGLH